MTDLEQRDIVCMANDAVFRVTRPASRYLFWPTLCDEHLRHASPLERASQRPKGYVVDNRRPLTRSQVGELRGRWRGRLGPKKCVTAYPPLVIDDRVRERTPEERARMAEALDRLPSGAARVHLSRRHAGDLMERLTR